MLHALFSATNMPSTLLFAIQPRLHLRTSNPKVPPSLKVIGIISRPSKLQPLVAPASFSTCIHSKKLALNYAMPRNILSVSKRAGIKQVVYTSVIAADRYQSFHNPDPESFFGHYFLSKHTIEKEVQNGDFETWTILRGAAFMTNYLLPSSAFMFPQLPLEGRFVSASTPESKLYLIDPEDIGQFGFAAFANPGKFGGKGIDIAAELLGVRQIAEVMERVSGKTVEVSFLTEEEREAQKENPLIMGQVVSGKLPPWFHLEEAKAWEVKLHSFEEFLEREKHRLQKSIGKLA